MKPSPTAQASVVPPSTTPPRSMPILKRFRVVYDVGEPETVEAETYERHQRHYVFLVGRDVVRRVPRELVVGVHREP